LHHRLKSTDFSYVAPRKQEEFERELEKFNIRRAPLGMDRLYRRYVAGLHSYRL